MPSRVISKGSPHTYDSVSKAVFLASIHPSEDLVHYGSAITVYHRVIDSQGKEAPEERHESQVFGLKSIAATGVLGCLADGKAVGIAYDVPNSAIVQKTRTVEIGLVTHESAP